MTGARERAHALIAGADADVEDEDEAAREEATRLLADARAEAVEAAERSIAIQLAITRRKAREVVLDARRRAYEELRNAALDRLAHASSSPQGRRLADWMEAVVREQMGAQASVHRTSTSLLGVIAELGHRRVVFDSASLVDEVLVEMAADIERLWT